jgi:hypothetical protein
VAGQRIGIVKPLVDYFANRIHEIAEIRGKSWKIMEKSLKIIKKSLKIVEKWLKSLKNG